MSKQRIVGTVESVVRWLSESDATSNQEDLELAAALQILRGLPEGAFSDLRTKERLESETCSDEETASSDAGSPTR